MTTKRLPDRTINPHRILGVWKFVPPDHEYNFGFSDQCALAFAAKVLYGRGHELSLRNGGFFVTYANGNIRWYRYPDHAYNAAACSQTYGEAAAHLKNRLKGLY